MRPMVTFTGGDFDRVVTGEITVTWRLWKYAHVKVGGVYHFGDGAIEVEDVKLVRAGDVTDADAFEAGLPDRAALLALVSGHSGKEVSADTVLYRVQLRYRREPPPRPQYDLDEVRRRLQRLDAASKVGAWTTLTLRLIEETPGLISRRLAAEVGMPVLFFKTNVRKLKALGLTISLPIGYELSELGQSYLDSLEDGSED